ncbi:MAG TPA: tRNA pseudouridine(38-40) synthase TruA [Candidatus Tripitaka sp. YC43]
MRNIKLLIEYDGTNFSGWQEQRLKGVRSGECGVGSAEISHSTFSTPNSEFRIPTIQACLREAIHKITGEWVVVYGASRTDAGVHALGQAANFKTSSRLPAERLVSALNYYLPREIVVRSAGEVPAEFHAQFHAKSKVYRYTILNDPVPRAINRNFYYHFHCPLDVERMKEAAQHLLGRHDFRAFCVEAHNKENTVRTIKSLEIIQDDPAAICGAGQYLHLVVEADGFLHKMIRGIVGTLLLVGSGKMGLAEFKGVVEARDRSLAGPTVPAKGLCLLKVNYTENGTWPG